MGHNFVIAIACTIDNSGIMYLFQEKVNLLFIKYYLNNHILRPRFAD